MHAAAARAPNADGKGGNVLVEALSPREQAQLLYDTLQRDSGAGHLVTAGVAARALQTWGWPKEAWASLHDLGEAENISFDTFFRSMQSAVGVFRMPGLSAIARSDRERSDAVFDLLDLDRSGVIELRELKILLVSWGVTAKEAETTILALDNNGDGMIDREEFYRNFVAVWRCVICAQS